MKFISILSILVFLVSCTTGYKKHSWDGGYKDEDLGNGKFKVEYFGNGTTSQELVLERWHQRSSELCPDGYSVIKSETKEEEINTAFFSGGVLVPFSTVHPEAKGEIQCKQS